MLRRPENVCVLEHVFFEGLKSGHKFKMNPAYGLMNENDDYDLAVLSIPKNMLAVNSASICFEDCLIGKPHNDAYVRAQLRALGMISADGRTLECPDDEENPLPGRLYAGTMYDTNDHSKVIARNAGHMGDLDHYARCSRLFGSYVYDPNPDPTRSN